MEINKEDDMTEYVKNKIMMWQEGQSIGLGSREKGTCVAFLYDKVLNMENEIEELKAKIGGDL